MNRRLIALVRASAILAMAFALYPHAARAQVQYSEDFTGSTTNNQWFFYNGACLTAGTNTSTTSPGYVPGCTTVLQSYYYPTIPALGKSSSDSYLVGGDRGFLGSTTAPGSYLSQIPDSTPSTSNPNSGGALRFTNGRPYGYHENGAIVSDFVFPTTQGLQITFKTVTYLGDSGGGGGDGADGISFYLLDGCMPIAGGTIPSTGCSSNAAYGSGLQFPGIGAWGGSLAYSCSNSNPPYDGLVGAYLGIGIDEYGNFLNGTSNTLGETGSTNTGGDNTASGGLYQPGRIGLRGAGSVSWQALNAAYGTDRGSSYPYYPSSLGTTCASGTTYYSGNSMCASCPSGTTYDSTTNTCSSYYACSTGTLSGTSCINICPTNYTQYGPSPQQCYSCSSNSSGALNPSKLKSPSAPACSSGYTLQGPVAPTSQAATQVTPTPSYNSPTDVRKAAVQRTCSTGNLYHYSADGSYTSVGAATLANTANTAGILDYPAIPSAYSVLSGVKIANESATLRGSTNVANTSSNDATPITYKLKITSDGLLSFSYSYNGGAYQPVITGQNITSSNGPLPSWFRFGFAGSTGGSNNIHEVMCFKAAPTETSQSSGGINVYENPTVKFGTQLFLAYYFPSDWTGQLTAQTIGYDTTSNQVVIASTPNWDASCTLTGGACASTGATNTAEGSSSRVMLTWNGTQGIPFQWSSLTTAQQAALDQGDSSQTSNRLAYLRGDRTNEIDSSGNCPQLPGLPCFRKRDKVLADIVDSSPTWVGPPQTYTTPVAFTDKLYPTATAPESAGETYAAFQQRAQSRLNVVYVGANDGFLHGFRAGSMDSSGNLVANTTTPNDGYEVLAYMPGTVLQAIHNSTNATLDYANTQYAHNWSVDATPGTGDVFYDDTAHPNGAWHTWLVGGLGPGGAAIYALDVTDPSTFSEANAATVVLGEWTPSNLTCVNVSNCGIYLGNTYGTPLIRRFHNGQWGVIFGNGFGSSNGTAGIYIMLINPADGSRTFYYLSTGSSATSNGIASTASADLDGDHVVDYIYAGDLKGNIWRFDVTSQNPAAWAVSASSPLFTTPGNQPITTGVTVSVLKQINLTNLAGQVLDDSKPERVVINFGTGQLIPQTVTTAAQYASGQQYLFGIWDWDMNNSVNGWNKLSAGQQAVGLSAPQTISTSNLQQQTVTTVTPAAPATAYRTVTQWPVCWVVPEPLDASSSCANPGTQFGWYMLLPSQGEQIVFNPVISADGELVVNTYIPVQDTPLSCNAATTGTGFTMALRPDNGAGSQSGSGNAGAKTGFFAVSSGSSSTSADGIQLNGTGIPWFISSGQKGDNNAEYLITQTPNGPAPPTQTNRHSVVAGKRLNWIQRR